MSSVKNLRFSSFTGSRCFISVFLFFIIVLPSHLCATDEFTFDLDEIEKKPHKMGGFLEMRGEHSDINQDSVFLGLNLDDSDVSNIDTLTGSIQFDGSYEYGVASLNWLLTAAAQQSTVGWYDLADVYSAYISAKPSASAALSLGKKSYKWGKGYAWNPVGFIDRRKDPNNPDEAREGFITAEADLIKSYSGSLQNTAFTLVALPVWANTNEDFSDEEDFNLAAKLYLLYKDIDIDLLLLIGDSRSNRIGLDFSTNLASNFEIHGEAAYIPEYKKITLQPNNTPSVEQEAATLGLLGFRYLSEKDITSIIEYYYNGAGYSTDEMSRFYDLAASAVSQSPEFDSVLLDRARELSLKGYGRPQPGRHYLYSRFTQKEPFDILYFTPGITTILNLQDHSYSINAEGVYSGFTNWEVRLRFYIFNGGQHTEYGEKLNNNKLELRIRYFF